MSAESLRARLDAIDTSHWTELHHDDPEFPNAAVIAHAPTDLAAALDVIEAAKAEFDGHPFARQELRAALDAFEALS